MFRCGGFSALAAAALSSGCGSSGETSDAGDGNGAACQFLATAGDFSGYTSWTHDHLDASVPLTPEGGPDAGPDLVHSAGPRDIYINLGQPGAPQCVTRGATEFPVGTIIIKKIDQVALSFPSVFAAVKRSANSAICVYNSSGAVGWEWFDLLTPQNGLPAGDPISVIWGSALAPGSSAYGADPEVCNNCHTALGSANDSMISSVLDLDRFECKP